MLEDELNEEEEVALQVPATMDDISEDFWESFEKLKNPYLRDPKFAGKALKQEKPKHKKAFLYWSQLQDKFRTDKAVAEQFEVTAAVVGKWRKSFNWVERRNYMRKDDLEQMQEAASRSLSDEVLSMMGTSHLVLTAFRTQVSAGKIDVSVNDFIKIGEFMLKLRRELGESANGEAKGAVGRIENILSGAGADVKQLLVGFLQMTASEDADLPHDEILDAEYAKRAQEATLVQEIGEDEQVEFDEEN